MQYVHHVLRERLLARAGLAEAPKAKHITLKELEDEIDETTWDQDFFRFMRNRLLMGRLRYGTKKHSSVRYNYTKSVADKIAAYEQTGNVELLVDIANYCLLEFRHGQHPNRHFDATDDADHCEVIK